MNTIEITIGDKQYIVEVAETDVEKKKGLQNRTKLASNKGMLFNFSYDIGEKVFHMRNVKIPLDIIFINEFQEVIYIHHGIPNSKAQISVPDVAYVLEVNADSGIKIGDVLDFDNEDLDTDDSEENVDPIMKVLAPDGSVQMELWGGERIFSRKNTVVLIRKAKKADANRTDPKLYDRYCKSLGKFIFKCLKIQDGRDPEYVSVPN